MSSFKKHLDAIKSGRITKSNVIGMRKAFNAFERDRNGWSNSNTAPKMTADEYSEAERLIPDYHPTVTGELHESGLKVLRNPRHAKRWTERERRIIDGACRFDLIRFDWIDATHCVPVYRVISRGCESFAFRNIAWQTVWTSRDPELQDGPRVVEDELENV